jgi:DNA-binding NarL/FixJ family response regulator
MDNRIQILLADDHRVFAEGVAYIIQKNFPEANVVLAESGEEAWEILSEHPVDLLITDISMKGMSGIELTRKVKQQHPHLKVLVLSMHNDRSIIESIMDTDAEGFVLKNSSARDMVGAIKDILDGSTHYSREVLAVMLQKIKKEKQQDDAKKILSPREIEILQLIVEEFSSEQIGEKLFISKRTVDTHRANIMEKTGSRTIISLVRFAVRHDLAKL